MRTQRPSSYGQIDTAYPAAGYGVEERTWPFACLNKLVKSVEVLLRHSGGAQVAAGEAERTHPVADKYRAFGRAVTDTFVLHQHDPTPLAGAGKPIDVGNGLVGGNSVHLGEGVAPQTVWRAKLATGVMSCGSIHPM